MMIAKVDTGSFEFLAIDDRANEDEAIKAVDDLLLLAWAKHCEDYTSADPDLMAQAIIDGDVNYMHTPDSGNVFRDGEIIA